MSTTIPFSYHLFHVPTGKHYYGIRYARGCAPSDLWTVYFSTSILVKQLIDEYGADSFKVEIRKTFTTPESALIWEHKVLRRLNVAGRDDWLNRHNGGNKFRSPSHHSDATKDILRKKITGIKRSEITKNKHKVNSVKREAAKKESGWKMPTQSVDKAVLTRKDRITKGLINPYSAERNSKMSASKKGTKRHYLPDGSFVYRKVQQDQ